MPRDAYQLTGATSRTILMIYAALCAVVLAYFATGVFGVDSYNHIARLTIECAAPGDPLLDMWRIKLGLIPNLALDLINLPLCGLVAAEPLLAGIATVAMLTVFACAWFLQRAIIGRTDWPILLVPALSFNLVTFMGYTNYLVGLAAFLLYAIYLFRKPFAERPFLPLAIVSNIAGLLLCLCHAFAGMAGGLLLFFWMLGDTRWRDIRAVVRTGLMAAACYILPVAFILLADKGPTDINFLLESKFLSLFSALMFGSGWRTILLTFLWVAAAYAGLREGFASLGAGTTRILLGLLAFLLIVPTQIGAAVDIDSRTAVLLTVLFVICLRLDRPSPRAVSTIVGLAVVTIILQLTIAIPARAKLHREVDEIRAAAATLPPYATVFSINGSDVDYKLHYHMASVATVAGRIFNPLEFSGKGMQPLDATPAFACRNVEVGRPLNRVESILVREPAFFHRRLSKVQQKTFAYAQHWTSDFSHVLYLHEGKSRWTPAKGLVPIAQGSFFKIYANPAVPVPGPRGPCR